MEHWELEAREAIRGLISRYAHCADRGRFEELVQLFAEDAVLEIEGRPPLVGRNALLTFLGATKTNLATAAARPFIRHHVSSVDIDVRSPTEARASSYFFVITTHGPDHWGRYRDQFTRTAGHWLFHHRKVHLEGYAPNSWAASNR